MPKITRTCLGCDPTKAKPPEASQSDAAAESRNDPDFLAKRATAMKALAQHGRLSFASGKPYHGISREEPDPAAEVKEFEGTPTDAVLAESLQYLPDLRRLRLVATHMSTEGFRHLLQLPKLELLFLPGPNAISAKAVQHISGHASLRELYFQNCAVTDKKLRPIGNLQKLGSLGLTRTQVTAACFQTIAKCPRIEEVWLVHEDLNDPIDRQTRRAIASLDGRLKWLSFGEWGETTIHPSMLPAIAEIQSLEWLDLGDIGHMSPEDLEPLRSLKHLRHLDAMVPIEEPVGKRFHYEILPQVVKRETDGDTHR